MKVHSPSLRLTAAIASCFAAFSAGAGFVQNPSFEANYNEEYPHYGSIDGWVGGSGLNLAEGPFHNNGTPIPDGLQIAFKQGSGELSQDITGLETGKRYWIQFYYDARACCGGTIDLSTLINGVELDKIANVQPVTGGSPYRARTVPFIAEGDTVTLAFSALVPSGDATVLIDAVSVVQRDEGNLIVINPSFEASGDVVDTGLLSPNPMAGWYGTGDYGINLSGSGPYADNGTAPDQDHVAFIHGIGSLTQTNKVVAGKPYQLSFAYNAPTGNGPHLQVKVGDAVVFEEDVSPVGASAAYRTKTINFDATDVTASITFAQTRDGEHSVLLDDVRLVGEVPPEIDPIALSPEVNELVIGAQATIFVQVPQEVLDIRAIDVVLRSSSGPIARFVDPSGALPLQATLHFEQHGTNALPLTVQGVGRGTATLQVADAGGLPVRNQVVLTVGTSSVRNPSFESTPVPPGVGYGAIAGWTGGSGLNATGPFSDNGIIPDRSQVAFLQGANALSQEVHGLIPGRTYWLQFYYNIRDCCPQGAGLMDLSVTLGGRELASLTGITAVGEGAPYLFHHVEFVADAASGILEFKSTPTGDSTLLLDGVTIIQREPGQVVIRNPSFEASGAVFPFPGYFPSIAGWDVLGGNRGANIDGAGPFTDNGRAQADDLVLFLQSAGASISQNLTGLVDGRSYILAFLVNARMCCDAADTAYAVSFADTPLLEESFQPVGGANGYLVKQATFTAAGTEGILKFENTTPAGDHTLLIDNVVVFPEAGSPPVILANPSSVTTAVGASATLGVAAASNGNPTYQWKKDGQVVPGQSAAVLTFDPVTAEMSGSYVAEVTGPGGTTVSAAAQLTVLEPIPGLFDTGVGPDREVLADGSTDTHYVLAVNPDDAGSAAARVQDGNQWPLVAGPWVANSELSKWIGPRTDPGVESPPSGPKQGTYVYRQNLDLTGYDPSTVVVSGTWATDNSGEITVNGVKTGITRDGFASFMAFVLTGVFKPGINQLDFEVINGDATGGPTGLRVENLTAVGARGGTVPPSPSLSLTRDGSNVRISWTTSSGFILESTTSLPSGWAPDPANPTTEGPSTVVTVNAGDAQRYYRLRK